MTKNWRFWTVVLEKTLESPLDSKEIKSVNLKGNQPWMFIGRTDAIAEAPILWPPDEKNWLKKTWCWERLRSRGGGNRMTWLVGITDSMEMSLSTLWKIVTDREACCAVVHRVANSHTWLSDWKTIPATRLQAQHGLTENLSNYGLLVYLYHMFNSIFQFANILFSYVGSTVYTFENSISMI